MSLLEDKSARWLDVARQALVLYMLIACLFEPVDVIVGKSFIRGSLGF